MEDKDSCMLLREVHDNVMELNEKLYGIEHDGEFCSLLSHDGLSALIDACGSMRTTQVKLSDVLGDLQ